MPDPPIPSPTTPSKSKPTLLHLGADIRWNHALYAQLAQKYNIIRTYSADRETFKRALKEKTWGDFTAMYRPFWNTGGEMGDWDEEMITLLPPSCRVFASAGAGFDWVDTALLAARGTIYCNAASACTESAADTALFLVLASFRLFSWSAQAAHACDEAQFTRAMRDVGSISHNPNGKTLGIVGLGRIGARVAWKVRRALEMRVVYFDVVRGGREREREVGVEWGGSLEGVLGVSDCVVLAAPWSGEVVLGEREFGWFKQGARLVNVARGKLVDEAALVRALDSGRLSAAGLDVHADEPRVNVELAKRRNVMLLSHTAGASEESHIGFERLGMENLLGWVEKGEAGLVSPVNLQSLRRDR